MKEINKLSEDYLKIIQDCTFSGLILVNKIETLNQLIISLKSINLDILDNCNYYMNLGNNILVQKFKDSISDNLNLDVEDFTKKKTS